MTVTDDAPRRVPLFAGLTDRSMEAIAVLTHEASFEAGDVLIREGDPGDSLYVILDGSVEVSQHGRLIGQMGRGSFVGEIALMEDEPRTATVAAVMPIRALVIGRGELEQLLERHPSVRLELRMSSADRERC